MGKDKDKEEVSAGSKGQLRKIDVEEVRITGFEIQDRVTEIAQVLSQKYRNGFTLIGILKGGKRFAQDVSNELTRFGCRHMVAFLGVRSYEGDQQQAKALMYEIPSEHLIKDKPIVLLDDIVDTGKTALAISRFLNAKMKPASVEFGAMVVKVHPLPSWVTEELCGFHVPAKTPFLIGYGLDYNDEYRELEDIVVFERKKQREKGEEKDGQDT